MLVFVCLIQSSVFCGENSAIYGVYSPCRDRRYESGVIRLCQGPNVPIDKWPNEIKRGWSACGSRLHLSPDYHVKSKHCISVCLCDKWDVQWKVAHVLSIQKITITYSLIVMNYQLRFSIFIPNKINIAAAIFIWFEIKSGYRFLISQGSLWRMPVLRTSRTAIRQISFAFTNVPRQVW